MSLTPRIDYSQGNDWDIHLKTWNDFHKPALDGIGFQDLITEQMHGIVTGPIRSEKRRKTTCMDQLHDKR